MAPVARDWLDEARRITHEDIPEVGSALSHAEQGRRLNVRAVGRPDWVQGCARASRRWSIPRSPSGRCSAQWWMRPTSGRDSTSTSPKTCSSASPRRSGSWRRHRRVRCARPQRGRRGDADDFDDMQAMRQALDGMHEARARLDDLLTTASSPELVSCTRSSSPPSSDCWRRRISSSGYVARSSWAGRLGRGRRTTSAGQRRSSRLRPRMRSSRTRRPSRFHANGATDRTPPTPDPRTRLDTSPRCHEHVLAVAAHGVHVADDQAVRDPSHKPNPMWALRPMRDWRGAGVRKGFGFGTAGAVG